ncbi:MAG TPA: hypothetical protein VFU15_09060 [Bacteroidia bacterium]|nr:hypothetical protein [Bacteroidia bacterium]
MKFFFPLFFSVFYFASCGPHHPGSSPGFDETDFFRGKLRADVKTSVATGGTDSFTTIKALHHWLPGDEYMHTETDANKQDAPRTAEENRNVVVTDLFIYGVKREDDNDFHLILASYGKTGKDQPYMTAEISGLPDSSDPAFPALAAVRKKFEDHFGDDTKKEIVFVADRNHPPVHLVSISGSLFFDNHHYGEHSSVQKYKVCTAWEIHPVTGIRFDDQ